MKNRIYSMTRLASGSADFIFIILLLFSILTPQGYAQTDKGKISSWHLEDTPHGISSTNKTYAIQWDVQHIDANGGHIRAKLWTRNKPECYSFADFKWTFSASVANVFQDENFKAMLSIDVDPGEKCSPPNDPALGFNIMSGVMWDKSIGGDISLAGKDLFAYLSSEDKYNSVNGEGVGDADFVVRDRTGIGVERDAEDGGFFIELFWRGNRYQVFYKYAPGAIMVSGISGNWTGKWHNNTFGTNGSCRFTFSESPDGVIGAVGNEGFGPLSGGRTGEAIALHTSAANDYEYWMVITFDGPDKIILRYVGFGHKGRRIGKNWTGYVLLNRE